MKYGATDLSVIRGSLVFVKEKSQEIRHYPGTNNADVVDLGKKPTLINCVVKAKTDNERIAIEAFIHGSQEENLEFHNFYYKRVITGDTGRPAPMTAKKDLWLIEMTFIALDPIPYGITTGVALY